MAFLINSDDCLGCGVCEGSCKASAISQNDDKYKINADKCTDCGECSEVCPVSCISGTKK
jgi:ferredoxin